jgi:predicted DsbA family dithiol-disulfide isomerase
MAIRVQIWSDFVCPFCMIAEQPLQRALAAVGLPVDVQWMPFELRPAPTPTLRPEDAYLQTVWPRSVYPLAAHYDVPIRLPSVSPQPHTALAWEGFRFAQAHGLGNAYNHRVLAAFFQEDRDIGSAQVLAELAQEVGLDREEFATALRQGRYRQAHQEALAQARAAGVSSVPAFRIGDQWLSGVQTQERLEAALRSADAATASAEPPGLA